MNIHGARPLQRIPARLPTQNYQTFQVASPLETHTRPVSCKDADCEQYQNGWRLRVEGLPPDLLHMAKNSGRRYTVERISETETWLIYPAGQSCFKSPHRIDIGRPEFYLFGQGDWRSYNPGTAKRVSTEEWLDRFKTNQDALETVLKGGSYDG